MDELLARHKKEQRELQARITQKKKNATKKTRKGVNDECETLERELTEQQQAELDALDPAAVEDEMEQLHLHDDLQGKKEPSSNGAVGKQVSFGDGVKDEPREIEAESQHRTKKPNRQKARLARRAAEQEAQQAAAAEEASNLPDLRHQELGAMRKQLEERGLVETFIQPDGHCLYSACAHSMDTAQVKDSGPYSQPYQNVRSATADFMAKHPDDFSPFMEEPLDSYVKKIRNTAEWGGQLELQAIARTYNVKINVLQADGRIETFEPQAKGAESGQIWLAYYRHSFGLGEHYNALRTADKT